MSLKPRNPWLAALASLLLPGLGHIYGGSLTKGLVLALLPFLLYVSGGLSRVVLHPFGWDLLVAVSVLFYLYVALDAFIQARRSRARNYILQPFNRWYWYLLLWGGLTFCWVLLGGARVDLFGFESYLLSSVAMAPTIDQGEIIVVDTRDRTPAVGKVMVYQDSRGEVYTKRVAALSGDSIAMRDGVVYRNEQAESCLGVSAVFRQIPYSRSLSTMTLAQGEIFMLGDNRDYSRDSRTEGTVHQDQLLGSVRYIGFSRDFSRIGKVPLNPCKPLQP